MSLPSLQTFKPIFLLFILIPFFPHIPAETYSDLDHSNSHHIAYSTLKNYQQYVYKFEGHFRFDRLAQLRVIADEGGSLQSIDCLQYEEFKHIGKLQKNGIHTRPFIDAHDSLVKKLDRFARGFSSQILNLKKDELKTRLEQEAATDPIHETITGYFEDENRAQFEPDMSIYAIVEKLLAHVKSTKPAHGFVMSCKLLMWDIFSEGGEATWLDVFTFMDQKENIDDFGIFRKLFDTATVQTAELDQIANLMIFKRHLDASKTATANGKNYNEGIVVGAGPIGLYTDFQLFMAGMRIFLVNNRPERYLRKQITFLDPKWTVQLRFLLGTRFNTLFMDKGARGQMTQGETGKVSILALEIALKERMVDLMTLVKFMEQNVNLFNIHHRLDMLYEAAFDGIYGLSKLTNGQLIWLANFETPQIANNRDGTKFRANLMKIKSKKYEQEGLDAWEALAKAKKEMVEEIVEVEGAKQQLGGNKIAKKKLPKIPFDFLVCAGGANDQMRNKYLGNPEPLIPERNYGVGMVDKVNWDEPIFEDLAVFIDVVSMQKEMADAVKRQNFYKTIAFSDISQNFIIKYSNLEHMLLTQEDPKTKQVIRIWESRPSIHIAASTPPALEQFIKDLNLVSKQEKEWVMDLKKDEQIKQDEIDMKIDKIDRIYRGFREVLERKWFLAVFDYALSIKHPRKKRIEKDEECASKFKPIKQQKILLNAIDRMPEEDGGIEEEDVAQQWAQHVEKKCPREPKMLRLYFAEFNVSTFALRIQAAQESVKSFKDVVEVKHEDLVDRHGKPIPPPPGLVIALGDANASPHFLTASGLSTGRLGVEHVAILIRNYNLGIIDESELIEQIGNKLDLVKKQVHRKAQEFEALVSQIVKN